MTNNHCFNRKHSSWVRNCGWEEGKQYICLAINTGWEYKLSRNLPSPYHTFQLQLHILHTQCISFPKYAIQREITITRIEALVFFISCHRMMIFFFFKLHQILKKKVRLVWLRFSVRVHESWMNEGKNDCACIFKNSGGLALLFFCFQSFIELCGHHGRHPGREVYASY